MENRTLLWGTFTIDNRTFLLSTFGNDKWNKIAEKLLSFPHRAKIEFEKFNCLFVDFFRSSLGRIEVMSIAVEREYTPNITRHICFAYQLTGFYMIRGFTERYFL